MITLITGTPGAGKTAYVVNELSVIHDRQLIIDGIPDLIIPHELPPEEGGIQTWPDWAPDGALIVIDEAQRIFRPRGSGSKVPPYVAALETHRHKGLDFIIITQHPNLIDQNVRRLVGRHIHLRATALGRWLYEWPECGEPDSRNSRAVSEQRRYKLPKQIFSQYKSASLHVKPKHRLPKSVFIFSGCLILASILGYKIYNSLNQKMNPDAAKVTLSAPSPQAVGAASPMQTGQPGVQGMNQQPLSAADYIKLRQPRVLNIPESAPVYDTVTEIKTFPKISACIENEEKCQCYSQQGTKLFTSEIQCKQYVKEGFFDPYREEKENQPLLAGREPVLIKKGDS